MKSNSKSVIFYSVAIILLGILIFQIISDSKKEEVQIKDNFVKLTMQSIDGKIYNISEYKGKKIILNFFATWCGPCQAEIPNINSFYQENKDKVVVLGIDIGESKDIVENFIKEKSIVYPILMDYKKNVAQEFGIQFIPTSFFLDEQGKIFYKHEGYITKAQLESILKSK